jgi:pimeloyl-ACP methyl ester carboxylesterase
MSMAVKCNPYMLLPRRMSGLLATLKPSEAAPNPAAFFSDDGTHSARQDGRALTMITAETQPTTTSLGGTVQHYSWIWQRQSIAVTYETLGNGSPVLLLPAMSTVSTREEMTGLATALSAQFQVTTLDWPGFGQSDRSALAYSPALYPQFLQDFVQYAYPEPVMAIAAGHAAGYVMQLAQQQPTLWSQIVLIAPTWRGPLPTMGASAQVAGMVRQMVRAPLLGQFLYTLNTQPAFLRWMYQRHVYSDPTHLTPELLAHKYQITQHPGARFAPAAFVTGGLDPVQSRAEFLGYFQSLSIPILTIIPEQAPPKSKAEMEVLTELPGIKIQRLPGTLGMHEEFAAEVAQVVFPFLTLH